jgi:hypothetical protein
LLGVTLDAPLAVLLAEVKKLHFAHATHVRGRQNQGSSAKAGSWQGLVGEE